VTLRKEVLALCRACGVPHAAFITGEHLDLLDDRFRGQGVNEVFAQELRLRFGP